MDKPNNNDRQLAACLAVAKGEIIWPDAIGPDSPSWSAAYQAIVDLRRERDRLLAEAAMPQATSGAQQAPGSSQPIPPFIESMVQRLVEALFAGNRDPAEVHIVDRRARHTISYGLRVGVCDVAVVVGPPPAPLPSHMYVVTQRQLSSTGHGEVVAVCENKGTADALVDKINGERTPSGLYPLWHGRAISYPVRR